MHSFATVGPHRFDLPPSRSMTGLGAGTMGDEHFLSAAAQREKVESALEGLSEFYNLSYKSTKYLTSSKVWE